MRFAVPLSLRLVFAVIPWLANPALPAAGPAFAGLDQAWVHERYKDGDFPDVINALRSYVSRHPTFSRHDSVFIAKHLAVVYSADTSTRMEGEEYMRRLLALMPSADLEDMYVSEAIERKFEEVRGEFMNRQAGSAVASSPAPAKPAATVASARRDSVPVPGDRRSPAAERLAEPFAGSASGAVPARESFFRKRGLILGVAAMAVGATTYVVLSNAQGEGTAPDKVYHVR